MSNFYHEESNLLQTVLKFSERNYWFKECNAKVLSNFILYY